jgi:hypothetical protein
MHLSYSVTQTDGRVTIRLADEMDLATSDELHTILITALGRAHVTGIVVDLTNVTFIDSTAISALVPRPAPPPAAATTSTSPAPTASSTGYSTSPASCPPSPTRRHNQPTPTLGNAVD